LSASGSSRNMLVRRVELFIVDQEPMGGLGSRSRGVWTEQDWTP